MLKTEMDKKANEKAPEGEPNEEQDFIDIFTVYGRKLVENEAPKLQGNASIDVLGKALFAIVNKVETEGAQKGVNFPMWVLIRGTTDILTFLVETTGVEVTPESVKAIIGIAVGKYIQNGIDTGKFTKEEAGQAAQELQQQMSKGAKPQEEQVPTTEQPPMAQPTPQMGGQSNGQIR